MTESMWYFAEANLLAIALFACYQFGVHKLTTFRLNRGFLLLIPALAAVVPLIDFQWVDAPIVLPILPIESIVITATPGDYWDWVQIFTWVYLAGVLFFFFRLLHNLFQLGRLFLQSNRTQQDGYWVVSLGPDQPSFSFLNVLFLNDSLSGSAKEIIVNHELVHIRQRHSIDLLFLQVVSVFFWFNPVWFYLKRSIVTVHEYLADAGGSAGHRDTYSSLLLSESFRVPTMALSHAFYHKNLLKTRIKMLYKKPSSARQRWRYALVIPVLLSWLAYTACTPESVSPIPVPDVAESGMKNYADIDQIPEYPGGREAMAKFLGDNIVYPKKAKEENIEGKVMISFVVDESGNVKDPKIIKSFGYGSDEEALRVIKLLNGWKPAMKNGKPVAVQLSLPIVFRIPLPPPPPPPAPPTSSK